MNGYSVADGSGGSFPFASQALANSNDQTVGTGILSTNASSGSPTCVVKYNVKVNAILGATVVNTASVSVSGITPSSPITAQGSYTFTVGASSLPVTLISFSASQQGENVILNWETTNEVNNSRFEIERNPNSISFETIGTVMADANNGLLTHSYEFTDPSPANGINYYRLKQIDIDGKPTYSPIQKVDFENSPGPAVRTYPNPVINSQKLTLDIGRNSQELIVKIITASGQLQSRQSFSNINGSVSLDVRNLSRGIYYS